MISIFLSLDPFFTKKELSIFLSMAFTVKLHHYAIMSIFTDPVYNHSPFRKNLLSMLNGCQKPCRYGGCG